MNSRNMPEEEELDHMFRQAADSFEPEFDPEAWREMEQKLDAANQRPAVLGTWTKRMLLALLLLVSGVTVYYFTTREPASTSMPMNATRNNAPVVTKTPEPTTPETLVPGYKEPLSAKKLADKTPTTNLPEAAEQTNQPTRLLQRPHNLAVKTLPKAGSNSRAGNNGFTNNQTKQNQLTVPVITNTDPAGTKDFLKNSAVAGANTPSTALNNKIGEQTNNPAQTENPAILPGANKNTIDSTAIQTELPAALMPADKVTLVDSTQANPTAEVDSALKNVPTTFMSKVSVSLVFGPDFSTVGFVKPEKASTNVGVLLSYHFSKRWAISTGAVRARKVYGAKPEDYHPGANYWPPGAHLPTSINAVCKVLDIPINVRYAVVALPRQSIYVQTGLSSYIMLHEDYRYDYWNYGKPYSKHWIVSNQNRHFFQVLNLSLGYSKQIRPGISVGAEPFVKIPLSGVGAGKVNLTSLGAFFSLGYRFR
ncbi:hypothetical protein HUW51_04300 [Adhaeribacter swui]|uniref:Outer membrane beta-barrel protein n=1 Tax=Adhaeribacter swui TaxID=2086471 RepID=A0A7G7G4A0_9BACT|nr:hypothetical protein [Adhaeribacter swui]QNF31984.1 hypothetical protein HUW51_04300 [Adhaeribacter swui]